MLGDHIGRVLLAASYKREHDLREQPPKSHRRDSGHQTRKVAPAIDRQRWLLPPAVPKPRRRTITEPDAGSAAWALKPRQVNVRFSGRTNGTARRIPWPMTASKRIHKSWCKHTVRSQAGPPELASQTAAGEREKSHLHIQRICSTSPQPARSRPSTAAGTTKRA